MTRRGRWLLLSGVLLLVLVLLVGPSELRQRAFGVIDPTDLTARQRLLIWQSGLQMARDHPLTGVGPGGVSDLYPRYAHPQALRRERGHVGSGRRSASDPPWAVSSSKAFQESPALKSDAPGERRIDEYLLELVR